MSSIPKLIALLIPLLLATGCIRHPNAQPLERFSHQMTAQEVGPMPSTLPGDRIVSSATTPTTRFADTQPTAFPRTRIVLRVADRGVTRRNWPLAINYHPSGDVLAGPHYWPSTDKALRRHSKTNVWLEPIEFLVNVALLPVRAILNPPWSKSVYSPAGGAGWRNVEQSGVIFQEREDETAP